MNSVHIQGALHGTGRTSGTEPIRPPDSVLAGTRTASHPGHGQQTKGCGPGRQKDLLTQEDVFPAPGSGNAFRPLRPRRSVGPAQEGLDTGQQDSRELRGTLSSAAWREHLLISTEPGDGDRGSAGVEGRSGEREDAPRARGSRGVASRLLDFSFLAETLRTRQERTRASASSPVAATTPAARPNRTGSAAAAPHGGCGAREASCRPPSSSPATGTTLHPSPRP